LAGSSGVAARLCKEDDTADPEKRNLEQTLQALHDSEINVTITMLWDSGVDFALISYMEYDDSTADDWHKVPSFTELADAVHKLALKM
jgi:hypothetical protein